MKKCLNTIDTVTGDLRHTMAATGEKISLTSLCFVQMQMSSEKLWWINIYFYYERFSSLQLVSYLC